MIDWFKLFQWFLIVFTIYVIFEVIRKILGGSLGFEELVITLLVANIGYTHAMHKKLAEHIGWHKGRKDF